MEEKKNEVTNGELASNTNQEEQNEEVEQKENIDEENINEEDEDTKENDDEEFELSSSSSTKKRKKRITYITFDEKYDYNSNYFYQELTKDEIKEITSYIEKFLSEKSTNKSELINFFKNYPNIIKGNVHKLQKILNESSEKYPNISSYKVINDFILEEYYTPKPSICECYFFPDGSNERKVVNVLRTCKKSLDIAIYTFTLESIAKAIIEVHNRGIPVRIICDNECEKTSTSKIKKLAAAGIVCKTDNCSYYMHHKFAVIDNSVVITGSFNWSSQAVNHNQENILFLENPLIAQKYTDEYNRLWGTYDTVINREDAIKYIEEKERIKKEKNELKLKKEKEKKERQQKRLEKLKQKENEKLEKQKEKEKLQKQKEEEKLKKQKEKGIEKILKQKEKERIASEKEKIKIEKLKDKENQKTQSKNTKNTKKEKKEKNKEEPKSKTKDENDKVKENEIKNKKND